MNSYEDSIIRKIVERNFSWGDLNPKYDNMEMFKTNVFCMFHANHDTPAAKFYLDEERDIWVLWCYSEKKRYTAYDYLKKIMCEERQLYNSPLEYLKTHMNEGEIIRQYTLFKEQSLQEVETNIGKKKIYIDNVYNESENIVDYIEELYTA